MKDQNAPAAKPATCLLLVLVLTLSACTSLTGEEPPVADSTLVEVLIDLHLARARSQLYGDVSPILRDSILARRGINAPQFETAMEYYAQHPEAYARLYSTVMDRLDAARSTRDSTWQSRSGASR